MCFGKDELASGALGALSSFTLSFFIPAATLAAGFWYFLLRRLRPPRPLLLGSGIFICVSLCKIKTIWFCQKSLYKDVFGVCVCVVCVRVCRGWQGVSLPVCAMASKAYDRQDAAVKRMNV